MTGLRRAGRPPRTVALLAAGLVATWGAGDDRRAHAEPGGRSSTRVAPLTLDLALAGKTKRVDIFVPEGAAPLPVVVVAHGFSRDRTTMRGWGERLAEAGYLVAIPDLPTLSDHARNAAGLSDLLRQLEAGAALRAVDPTREALMGFSAGGLAALVAAAGTERVALWVGLDPVDRGGAGLAAAAHRRLPAVLVTADPSACNAHGNAAALAAGLTGPWLRVAVFGGSHCDAESRQSRVCGLFCAGGWDAGRHAVFVDYATAGIDLVLGCRPAAWERLARASADPRVAGVSGPGLAPVLEDCRRRAATP